MAAKYTRVRQNSGCSNCGNQFVDTKLVLIDVFTRSSRADLSYNTTINSTSPTEIHKRLNRNYILVCVINHIFDNIFPSFQELIIQQIVLVLWSLVPEDIAQSVKACTGTCSKDRIISAFHLAECSKNGFSEKALDALINLQNNGTLRDLVIDYIEQAFAGQVVLSETYGSVSSLPTSNFGSWNFPTGSCSSLRQNIHSEIPAQAYNHAEENRRIVANWYSSRCLAVLITGLIVAAISCYCTYLILTFNYNSVQLFGEPFKNASFVKNIRNLSYSRLEESPCYNVTVNTYKEYNDTMSKLSSDREIYLIIKVTKENDWPMDAFLGNTNLVTTLDCNLGMEKLLDILKKMRNIQNLIIRGTKFTCGAQINAPKANRKVILPALKHISVKDINECSELYKFLSKSLIMMNLQTFTISNGVITNNNSNLIQRLLQNVRSSLSSIKFPGTYWMTSIFNSKLGTLEKVRSIRVDFMEKSSKDILYINRHVDNILPNLKEFSSEVGYIPWGQFLNMSDCKKMERISIGVLISKQQESVNVFSLRAIFPLLKELNISFIFEDASNLHRCEINGIPEMKTVLKDFIYQTNCYDADEYDRIHKLLQAVTESKEVDDYWS